MEKLIFLPFNSAVFTCFWLPYWEGSMPSRYVETVDLWFTTFEFNGSLYNIVRALGYQLKAIISFVNWVKLLRLSLLVLF